jgi:hypothetical protein
VDSCVRKNKKFQILTDSGWEDFDGVIKHQDKECLVVHAGDFQIECTPDHEFFRTDFSKVAAEDLELEDKIWAHNSIVSVIDIEFSHVQPVFDIINAGKNHRFLANNLLVSNCEFVGAEEILLDPQFVANMTTKQPIENRNNVRWYEKIHPNHTYAIGLDPSMGSGGDYAAIQVYDVTTMTQVAEWQHNRQLVEKQFEVVIDIIYDILDVVKNENQIYWTVENNSLGEAVLLAIRDIGEDNIPGIMLSDGKKRKGYNTNSQTKLAACMKFKSWVESGKLMINSKNLLSELKNYVATGKSYAAKQGETDDLIAASLIVVRMIIFLNQYNSDLSDIVDEDEYLPPMPFLAIIR